MVTAPINDKLRATIMVYKSGKIQLANNVTAMPADIAYAVSGNAMLLQASNILPKATDATRAPRSAVGISADGGTLLLVAVDGRQTGYSVGASLYELAQIMLDLRANDAINLDGGGSTAMVLKDEATGVFSLLNQPSDGSADKFPQRVERPVVDIIGVRISGR
jgi:exopolysaccharide biosynthesis protein